MTAIKQQQLDSVNERIDTCLQGGNAAAPDSAALAELAPLLSYKREIAGVSTWPFDIGNVTRFSLYLVIPPLTWVAAALIENLVDSVL
jgi:hypothetical protein